MDSSLQTISNVQIRVAGTAISAVSNTNGEFELNMFWRPTIVLQFHHLGFKYATRTLHIDSNQNKITITQHLVQNMVSLEPIAVTAIQKPETLVGKPHYSIFDFDFCDHGLILLTAEKSMRNATLRFSDFSGTVLTELKVPNTAGEALHFFHDYQGFTELICKDSVFRIEVYNDEITISGISKLDFAQYLQPISDTVNKHLLWTNKNEAYPAMDYYSLKRGDSVSSLLRKISNADLLKLYNLEYYYLPSRAQLEARRIADFYKTDVHIVAAVMSGFTQSMFYESLYAPLIVANDTICIFDHYSDYLFHYSKDQKLIDSLKINYHHPAKWREWKNKLYYDEAQSRVWAHFSKDGHTYLKEINWKSGEIIGTYKLQNHSADKLKIRDGYVYYVYRPFESTQEKFLYREQLR